MIFREKNTIYLRIITFDPLIYTIDHPKFNVLNLAKISELLMRNMLVLCIPILREKEYFALPMSESCHMVMSDRKFLHELTAYLTLAKVGE